MSDISNSPNNDDYVLSLFKYTQSAFGKIGINVAFPQNTDPRKTYKWRYMVKFAGKLKELDITGDIVYRLIDAVAAYSVKHRQQRKGLSLLVSDQILKVCCDIIEKADANELRLLARIRQSAEFVRSNDPMYRQAKTSLPNIVKWYIQGLVPGLYIALSERCHLAMVKIPKVERTMLPSGRDLIELRSPILCHAKLKHKIKIAMGDDWRSVFG